MMDRMMIADVRWRVDERILLKFQLAICCTWLAPHQVNTWMLETNKATDGG